MTIDVEACQGKVVGERVETGCGGEAVLERMEKNFGECFPSHPQ